MKGDSTAKPRSSRKRKGKRGKKNYFRFPPIIHRIKNYLILVASCKDGVYPGVLKPDGASVVAPHLQLF